MIIILHLIIGSFISLYYRPPVTSTSHCCHRTWCFRFISMGAWSLLSVILWGSRRVTGGCAACLLLRSRFLSLFTLSFFEAWTIAGGILCLECCWSKFGCWSLVWLGNCLFCLTLSQLALVALVSVSLAKLFSWRKMLTVSAFCLKLASFISYLMLALLLKFSFYSVSLIWPPEAF